MFVLASLVSHICKELYTNVICNLSFSILIHTYVITLVCIMSEVLVLLKIRGRIRVLKCKTFCLLTHTYNYIIYISINIDQFW